MNLYRNTYCDGHEDFSVEPNPNAQINQAEAWELPTPITYGESDKGENGFIYEEYWWRSNNGLHTVNLDGRLIPYVIFFNYGDTCFEAYLFYKKGEKPPKPEKMETESVICENCQMDVSIEWNVKMFGSVPFCPHCGKPMHIR